MRGASTAASRAAGCLPRASRPGAAGARLSRAERAGTRLANGSREGGRAVGQAAQVGVATAARTAALGATGLWTVFDAGRLRANVQIESAREEQVRRSALEAGAAAAARAAVLARQQYESGLLDVQSVLDAQRTLLSLQDQLAESDGAVVSNLIALHAEGTSP